MNDLDVQMMRRSIRLAMNGRGRVEPNPMVGCVLVKDGRVMGEGFHAKFGGPHAEPTALASATESPAGATAYVTLEPCCHANKKTPPCVPALIDARIARVVVGCVDPNLEVNGKGIEQLRAAGIDVTANVCEDEAKQLVAPFIARIVYQRPYITLKWAETEDGKVAGAGGKRLRITSEASHRLVHTLRSRCDSILVGVNTVLTDDPLLTARDAREPRHPARFVLDTNLRTPPDARIIANRDASTTIVCAWRDDPPYRRRCEQLQSAGANIMFVGSASEDRLSLAQAIGGIFDSSCRDLLVEPGPTLARSVLERDDLVDRIWQFRSSVRVDEPTAPAAAGIGSHFVRTGTLALDGDTLTEFLNPRNPVFFAPQPSADFVLAREAVGSGG